MNRNATTAAALVLGTLVIGAASVRAQGTAAPLAEPGTKFLAEAIRGGLAEVELGKAAAQKASSPEVKQFAERMVTDHTAANEKLMDLAKKYKIETEGTYGTQPLRPDEQKVAKLREMSGMSGEQFDQAYVRDAVEDHQAAVDLFKSQTKEGKSPDVVDFAKATLPVLEEHLEAARSLAGKVGTPR